MSDLHIGAYPSIYQLGHRAIATILDGEVVVQEKVDGSQFSFERRENDELVCRSKGAQINVEEPEKMFARAVEVVKDLDLVPGWVYRAEYLQKPKHNTLAYDRIPLQHLALFDVQSGIETYETPGTVSREAGRLGISGVPTLLLGRISSLEDLKTLLKITSFLGGQLIEGVVIKRYDAFTPDKKVMLAKYVSEAFKEKHRSEWKVRNPNTKDVILTLTEELRTEARWQKAVQYLREAGQLEGSPKDIGALIKEVGEDVLKEEEEQITAVLFKHAWPKIRRGLTIGLPEWYKERLAESAMPTPEHRCGVQGFDGVRGDVCTSPDHLHEKDSR